MSANSNEQATLATELAVSENTASVVLGEHIYLSLMTMIEKYIYCSAHQQSVIALWVVMTWCISSFNVAPIFSISAMTKGAGKSQLLNLIGYLCKSPVLTSNITPAALFRYIQEYQPTILIDEADTFLNRSEDLRGIVNAGFERSSYIIRCVGQDNEPMKFNVFCPKAIAGIGRLTDTIQSRSIVINLHRKPSSIVKENLRIVDESMFEEIKHDLEQWAQQNFETLKQHDPQMPDRLSDRQKDCWAPLFAIADLLGGDVAAQARSAAIEISSVNTDEPHINEQLLADIQKVFVTLNKERITTIALVNALCEDEEALWKYFNKGGMITPRQIAQILKQFNVSSKQIRFGEMTKKGYDLADFGESFAKHLR